MKQTKKYKQKNLCDRTNKAMNFCREELKDDEKKRKEKKKW